MSDSFTADMLGLEVEILQARIHRALLFLGDTEDGYRVGYGLTSSGVVNLMSILLGEDDDQ